MSFQTYKEYFIYDKIKIPKKKDKYIEMIYKPNENKKEKKEKIEELEKTGWFKLNSDIKYKEDAIRIFGRYFIQQNKNKSKIIYNNKLYELKEYFNEIAGLYNHDIKDIKLKLIGINYLTNMKKMFHGCYHLSSISEIKNKNVQNINYSQKDSELIEKDEQSNSLYNKCNPTNNSLSIEKLSSVKRDSKLISNNPLYYLPSISNSIFYKIKNLSFMFSGCISLKSLPDISNWDTSNVTSMEAMFQQCSSLISLSDISKWDTSNVIYMNSIFYGCTSLISLPNISRWNISKVKNMKSMLRQCTSLKSLPDKSKLDTSNIIDMGYLFS